MKSRLDSIRLARRAPYPYLSAVRLGAAGFTLLELLVVLFIIGITLSFAVLSVGDRGRERSVEQEAQSLAARLNIAAQESVLRAEELALEFSDRGYRFLVLNRAEWQPLGDDELLRPRRLPAGIRLKLSLEGEPILLGNKRGGDKREDDEKTAPRIYLLSSGEMTAFELTLHDDYGENYRLRGEANGRLSLRKLTSENQPSQV